MLGKTTYASEVRCQALERFSCGDAFVAFRSNICQIEDQAIHQALLRHIHPHARPKRHLQPPSYAEIIEVQTVGWQIVAQRGRFPDLRPARRVDHFERRGDRV